MDMFSIEELKRKTFHLMMLLYIAAYWVLPRNTVLLCLAAIIIVVLVGENIRLRLPDFNRWILGVLGGVHRKEEETRLSGLTWTLSGSFFTMLLFLDKKIVLVSLLYLAFGDTLAALIGKRWGKHRIVKGKSLEGSLACFAACLVVGSFFFSWPLAILGAFIATVIELIPWPLNDNFWMQLITTAALTFLITFF